MPEGRDIFVRHGHADQYGMLTEQGKKSAHDAVTELRSMGVNENALVLASVHTRAVMTGEIIAAGLKTELSISDLIKFGGTNPEIIKLWPEFLNRALGIIGVKRASGQDLVVVTHAPMISVAKGEDQYMHDVGFCEIVVFNPDTWSADCYNEKIAQAYHLA